MSDRPYLDWLKTKPCFISGMESHEFEAIDPAHIGVGGVGLKSGFAIPLRHELHQESHQKGFTTFWLERIDKDPNLLLYMLQAVARDYRRQFDEQS